MSKMEFLIPAKYGKSELTEKRSVFIGQVWPVKSEEEARDLIQQAKSKYHDARHNCWCFIIHEDNVVRYSDDGEPQGTAGQPMLEVFTRKNIENVCCIVTRYFGGILLGTGGLVRAYTAAAQNALEQAGVSEMGIWHTAQIVSPYNLYELTKKTINQAQAVIEEEIFEADVRIKVLIPEQNTQILFRTIAELSAGKIRTELGGSEYRSVMRE